MLKLAHKFNKGLVEVSDSLGDELLKSGLWESTDKPAPKKAAPKKAEEPKEG